MKFRDVMRYLIWVILVSGISYYSISTNAQTISTFTDQKFDRFYAIDIHFDEYGNQLIAVRGNPDPSIFILDAKFDVIRSYDPLAAEVSTDYSGGVNELDWNPTGTHLAVPVVETPSGSFLQIWDIADNNIESYLFDPIASVDWSPRGDFIAVRNEGKVILWDFKSQQPHNEIILPGMPIIQDMAWSSDGTRIAIINVQGVLQVWDVDAQVIVMEANSDSALMTLPEIEQAGKPLYYTVVWETDRNRLALSVFSGDTPMIDIWNIDSGKRDSKFSVEDAFVQLRWGRLGLAIISPPNKVTIWDVDRQSEVGELELANEEAFAYLDWHPTEPEIIYSTIAPNRELHELIRSLPQ